MGTLPLLGAGPMTGVPALVTTNLLVDFDVHALALGDGADITTLSDASGNGHHATGVAAHKPVFHTGGPGGKSYASFSGSQIAKTTDVDVLPAGTAERIVFVVFKTPTRTPGATNLVQYGPNGSGGAYWSIGLEGGTDSVEGYFWSLNTSTRSVGDISQWHAVALQIKADGHPRWWIDGVDAGSDGAVSPNTGAGTVLSVGGNGGAGDGDFVGDMARVTGYGALTDGEIAAQFAYLQNWYGL